MAITLFLCFRDLGFCQEFFESFPAAAAVVSFHLTNIFVLLNIF